MSLILINPFDNRKRGRVEEEEEYIYKLLIKEAYESYCTFLKTDQGLFKAA